MEAQNILLDIMSNYSIQLRISIPNEVNEFIFWWVWRLEMKEKIMGCNLFFN